MIRSFSFSTVLTIFMLVAPSAPSATTTLVSHATSWRYRKGTNAPQADWKTVAEASLDGTWATGAGGFGYADNSAELVEVRTQLPDMLNSYSSVYTRKSFQISSSVDPAAHLLLTLDWDDGFIAWLDGVYLTNRFTPNPPSDAFANRATASHESSNGNNTKQPAVTFDLGAVGAGLAVGTHVLAVMGLNETLGSSDLILIADLQLADATIPPVVAHGSSWRYFKGTSAPQSNWQSIPDSSLNGSWLSGPGGFGYGDGDDASVLTDMQNLYTTVYIRRSFTIASPPAADDHVLLTLDWDDGFVAYLDGNEVERALAPGAPGTEPAFNAVASGLHEASAGSGGSAPVTYDLGVASARLTPGTHILALIGLNEAIDSSDLSLIADLYVAAPPPPPPGTITTDTTWSLANSPYAVTNNLTVMNGVTLTIEAGVTVRFNNGLSLIVDGRLNAEGNENNHIQFTRAPGATSWGGIVVHGDVETRIAFADFAFNNSVAIHSDGGTVWLDHLHFANTSVQYVSLDSSSFVVSDCVFPSGTVKFELVHGTGGIKAGGHGILARNFFGRPIGYSDVVDFTGGNRPGPILHVIDNVFSGSQDDGVDLDGTDAWVEGNIFLHVHRNGDTPDSSAAVSGGSNSGNTSEVTIIGNLFFDCDNAATAKQGNFFTLINNTIVHTTKTGGIDGASGVVNVRDTTPSVTTFARGCYLEGNIIVDAEQLVRNYDAGQTTVTLNNNILPTAWNGPGSGNAVTDPMLSHIPQVSETVFTSWAQAQIMRTWFGLQPGSPAINTGPNGLDKGGVIPLGASISGEPANFTAQNDAVLMVGVNRTGFGMPASGWPNGCGYTLYKWRLDTNAWSAETPINTPITLTGLANGPHYVEVSGQRDSGLYQDDPLFGLTAAVTRSLTWVVGALRIESISLAPGNSVQLQFTAEPATGYTVWWRDSLSTGSWQVLALLDPVGSQQTVIFTDVLPPGTPSRFYQLSTR